MNTITRNIINEDGSIDTILISSEDNYKVNINKNYCLANRITDKKVNRFRNTILGSDIGFHSAGFASMMVIASLLAVSTLVTLYFMWRI